MHCLTGQRPRVRPLVAVTLAALVALVGCERSATPPEPPPSAAAPLPDAGRVQAVAVEAEGYGASASEAVAEALQLAVLQINGASLDASTTQTRLGLDVFMGTETARLGAQAVVDQIRQRSGGMVQGFRILSLDAPLLPGGRFKARIEAQVARFEASKDLARLRIVLAPLRMKAGTVTMGNQRLPAAEVERMLRQRLSDALVQTGRLAVLDREFPAEVQRELDMIAGGQAPGAETAKLGQAVSADLVWIGRIDRLGYDRHVRKLRTSERELVSYSGGWALDYRLVNVATRQVTLSGRLAGTAPSTAPTTLGTSVDGQAVFDRMSQALVDAAAADLVRRLFPITVVSRNDGDVVLSQGGQVLRVGDRHAVVALGGELTDPQTGQSLGHVERPCCTVVIDRVTPQLAYGRLENVGVSLDALPLGGLQLRDRLPTDVPVVASPQAPSRPRPVARPTEAPAADTPVTAPAKADDKW